MRTRTWFSPLAGLVAILLLAEPAWAFWGVADTAIVSDPYAETLLSQQVSLMAKDSGTLLLQYGELGEIVTNITNVLRVANELAGYARFGVNVFNAIRHYDLQALRRDVEAGLAQSSPQLAQLVSQIDLTTRNIQAVEEGPVAFFNMRDYRDQEVQHALGSIASSGVQNNLYARLFPTLYANNSAASVTEADKLPLARFLRTGLAARAAADAAASNARMQIVDNLNTEASGTGRLDLILGAQQVATTQGMYDIMAREKLRLDSDDAETEAARQGQQDANSALSNALQDSIRSGSLVRPIDFNSTATSGAE